MAERLQPDAMQELSHQQDAPVERINVRLILDEMHSYDEALPVDVVKALINPNVADFFIWISKKLTDPPRCKGHLLHTSYVREMLLLDELPSAEAVQTKAQRG